MRDPARIDDVLAALRAAWVDSPDLRLGQLLVNAIRPTQPCPELRAAADGHDLSLVINRFPAAYPLARATSRMIIYRLIFLFLTTCTAFDASADDRIACPKDFYVEAKTLSALPDAVRLTLTYAPHKSREISDAGGQFNAGDVGGGPYRRLALAAIGLNQVVVALEQGGVGYSVEVWAFTQSTDGWVGQRQAVVTEVPGSLKQLVDIVCR